MVAGLTQFASGPISGSFVVTSGVPVQPGRCIQISVSEASVVTLTLTGGDGSEVVVNPNAAGDFVYPYAIKLAVVNSGTVTAMYNLY